MKATRVLGLVAALVVLTACGTAEATTGTGGAGGGGSVCTSAGGQQIVISGVDDVQLQNSQAVYQVAQGLPLSQEDKDKAAVIGVTVIWTEATAGAGYPYGQFNTGDVMNGVPTSSRGLFQQMSGWGTLEQRLDPVQSAGLFFNGGMGGQEGLLDIAGWQQLPIEVAAQRVEKSQFADGRNYKPNISRAESIVQALGGSVTCTPSGGLSGGGGAGMEINNSQDPSSFGWVHGGPQEPLNFQGKSLGTVAAGTAKLWTAMLTELVPTIPGGLNNDLGCFEDRNNVNSPGRLSFHAYGLACDLNSGVNCNGCSAAGLQGRQYALPLTAPAVMAKYGMVSGIDFTGTPDPMHAEIHITPDQVAAWNAAHP